MSDSQPTNSPEGQAKLFAELEKLGCEYKMTMETPHFEHDTYKRGFDMYELADYILGNYLPKQAVLDAIAAAEKGSASPGRDNACYEIRQKLNLHDNQQRNEP